MEKKCLCIPTQHSAERTNWNWKSRRSCCLSLPKPISRSRDWIFMGALLRWPAIWEDSVLGTLIGCLKFHSKATLFIRRRKLLVRGLELREKVNQIKAAAFFHLCPGWWSLSVSWAVEVSPWSTTLTLDNSVSDAILTLAVLLRHKGGTIYSPLKSRWVTPSVPGTIAFYIHRLLSLLAII